MHLNLEIIELFPVSPIQTLRKIERREDAFRIWPTSIIPAFGTWGRRVLSFKTSVIFVASSGPTRTAKLNLVQEKKLESKRHKESKLIIFTVALAVGLGIRSNDGWPSSCLLKPFPQFTKPNCYKACTGHWSMRNIRKCLKEKTV